MGRGAAEHPLALPEWGCYCVIGNRSNDGKTHTRSEVSLPALLGACQAARRALLAPKP